MFLICVLNLTVLVAGRLKEILRGFFALQFALQMILCLNKNAFSCFLSYFRCVSYVPGRDRGSFVSLGMTWVKGNLFSASPSPEDIDQNSNKLVSGKWGENNVFSG